MPDDTRYTAVIESLKATASELQARPPEDMTYDWADRMAEALAAAGLLADPDMRRVTAEMAAGLNAIAEMVGLSPEAGEPELIVNRVRDRLAAPAPLTDDQQWQWRASMIADLSGLDYVTGDDSPIDRAYFEAIADGLLKAGWRFRCASSAVSADDVAAAVERVGYAMYLADYAVGAKGRGSRAFGVEEYRRDVAGVRTDYDRRARAAFPALRGEQK
jgi:hypothetical protein